LKQEQFVARRAAHWEALERFLGAHSNKGGDSRAADFDFPHVYRQVCHDLALARSRMYSQPLINRLNELVIQGHQRLYRRRPLLLRQIALFFAQEFPALVRQEWKLVTVSAVLFLGSLLLMLATIQFLPDLVYSVIDAEQVASVEDMYSPDQHERLGRERAAQSDIFMFGFYIRNNTGIGFRTFAGGLFFGLGSIFFLLFNGISIGSIAGHLTHVGYNDTFWGFVSGHSSMELTAIILSGAAGLKLGMALVKPGRKSRSLALRDNASIAIRIVYGAATMFIIAAFIEAFWSSKAALPLGLKVAVGILLWILMLVYFLRQGSSQTR